MVEPAFKRARTAGRDEVVNPEDSVCAGLDTDEVAEERTWFHIVLHNPDSKKIVQTPVGSGSRTSKSAIVVNFHSPLSSESSEAGPVLSIKPSALGDKNRRPIS